MANPADDETADQPDDERDDAPEVDAADLQDDDTPPEPEPEIEDDEGATASVDAVPDDSESDDEDGAGDASADIDEVPGLSVEWKGHTLKVVGDWTFRWLWLAPTYELWLDDQLIDRITGPRVRPLLEAVYEDADGELLHIEADILSLVGLRPKADILVEGEIIKQGRVPVMNTINPFLILVIIIATAIMIYVGPDVLRSVYHTQFKG